MQQLIAMPGIRSAQRFKQVIKITGVDTNPYLAIYDIECDDPIAFLGVLGKAVAAGEIIQTDTADRANAYTALFTEHGEQVFAKT